MDGWMDGWMMVFHFLYFPIAVRFFTEIRCFTKGGWNDFRPSRQHIVYVLCFYNRVTCCYSRSVSGGGVVFSPGWKWGSEAIANLAWICTYRYVADAVYGELCMYIDRCPCHADRHVPDRRWGVNGSRFPCVSRPPPAQPRCVLPPPLSPCQLFPFSFFLPAAAFSPQRKPEKHSCFVQYSMYIYLYTYI